MTQPTKIICVTTDTVPGRTVQRILGMVWGVGVTNKVGDGNLGRLYEIAHTARRDAYTDLLNNAISMGANAVIGAATDSFVSTDDYNIDREYTYYGTAVILD